MNCSQCGAEVGENDAFCGSCGNPVARQASGAAAPGAAQPGASTPPQPEAPGPQYGLPPQQYGTPPPAGSPPPPPYGAQPPPPYGAQPPPPGSLPQYPGTTTYQFRDPLNGAPTAEWWQRAVALIIDGLIIGIPTVIIYAIVYAATATTTYFAGTGLSVTTHNGAAVTLVWVIGLVAWAGYYVILNGSERGQTVGKMVLSIATRDESGQGSIGFGRALGRWAIVFVCSFCFIPEILNYLWPLWDSRRQAWHDKVAHSLVIKTK